MVRIIFFIVTFAFAGFAFADCRVRLKHPVPNCPAVTYGPEDCLEDLWGKAGELVTHYSCYDERTLILLPFA